MQGFLKLGIGYFIFSLVMLVLMRFAFPVEMVFGWKLMLLQFIASIVVLVILGRKYLRSSDYMLTFGEAIKGLFMGSIFATVLSMVATIAVFNGDTEYQERFAQTQIETSISSVGFVLKVAGKSESEIAIEQEKMRADIESGEVPTQEFPFQWNNLPMLLLTGIIGVLIYALIAGIFVKQKQSIA